MTDELNQLRNENRRLRDQKVRESDKQLEEINKKLGTITEVLIGKPTSPEKGLVIRTDRIEQRIGMVVWLVRLAVGTAMAAIVGLVIKHFFGR